MSDGSPLNYTDLGSVKALLNIRVSDEETPSDALLVAYGEEVTERITRELGVRWDGGDPAEKLAPREVAVLGNTAHFDVPAYAVEGVYLDGVAALPLASPAFYSRDRGWFRGVVLSGYASLGLKAIGVIARWADDPGGQPPATIRGFANAATAQLWRVRQTGATSTTNMEGSTVTFDVAFKARDWEPIARLHRVRGRAEL